MDINEIKKYKNKQQFLQKKSHLEKRLQKDILENDTAYIPCKVGGMEDIISKFSMDGFFSLDAEFLEFIMGYVECIPPEYPVILEIYGPKFSSEEKNLITETISDEMAYILGRCEEENEIRKRRFSFLVLATIVSAIILGFARRLIEDVPLEFFYVIFWLFADALVRYLFIEKKDYREEKIRMGRLASMKVEFVEDKEDAKKGE
ncbi:MAG: hypothetical protein K6A69_10435 [Lachnospiraceae bacterium]|nr:hypothetical protein [Lachnospiraceae bacterium]